MVYLEKKEDVGVRIAFCLIEEVEVFINLEKNNFKYINRKRFRDIAVDEYLRKQGGVIR